MFKIGRRNPKKGPFRAQFILDAVADLRDRLDAVGFGLLVGIGSPDEVFDQIATRTNASGGGMDIYCQYEFTRVNETGGYIDDLDGHKVTSIWGPTLYHIDDLPVHPFQMRLHGGISKFKKYIQQVSHIREPIEAITSGDALPLSNAERDNLETDGAARGSARHTRSSQKPASISFSELPTLPDLGFQEDVPFDERQALLKPGGESFGIERINEYFFEEDHIPTYHHTREQFGQVNSASRLSAWLALGCISARRLYAETVRYENEKVWLHFQNDDEEEERVTYKNGRMQPPKAPLKKLPGKSIDLFVLQLLMRDFFHFMAMDADEELFRVQGYTTKTGGWNLNKEYIECWKAGMTGYPAVDANMRELNATGFISNRGRMVVASFLALDLEVDWRVGAEYFETMLVDHDIATNWGNWLYSAGLTRHSKNRPITINAAGQTIRYDKHGDYVRRWIPELAAVPAPQIHRPWKMTPEEHVKYGSQSYPKPMIDTVANTGIAKEIEKREMLY